jgi:23S rRNA (guanosine2251-2'-O)-methyltransferase
MGKNRSEIIYGIHTVRHALEQMPENILELLIQKDKKSSRDFENLLDLAKNAGVSIQQVTRDYLDKNTNSSLHQGIAVKRKTDRKESKIDLDTILENKATALLFLVLEGIQDPHNLGACLRTANAVGVDAVILPKDRSVAINATVSKVASGGAENTPVITVSNIARTLRKLQEAGVWVVGTAADVETSLYDIDLTISAAIIMGSEGKGLRQNTREHCDYLVNLPMHGVVESLNVSVATGVCLYEVLRQRKV